MKGKRFTDAQITYALRQVEAGTAQVARGLGTGASAVSR